MSDTDQLSKALFEARIKLQKIQDLLGLGIWEWDILSNELTWSDRVFMNFGYEPHTIAPTFDLFFQAVHPEDRGKVQSALDESARNGTDYFIEFRIRRSDGDLGIIQARGSVLFDGRGLPARMIGVDLDITLRKSEEKTRKRYEFMVENSGQEAYLVHPDGRFSYVNPAAARSLGYTVEELLALGVPGIDRQFGPRYSQHFEELREADIPPFETVHISKDGRFVPKEIKSVYLRIEDEEFVCGFGCDISERKHAESVIRTALEEKQILLRELNHRVKNNLQLLSSLLKLSSSNVDGNPHTEILNEARMRVEAISLIHEDLYQNENPARVNARHYINKLVRNLMALHRPADDKIKSVVEIENVNLSLNIAVPVGLLVNEMVTNVLKHAFRPGQKGSFGVFFKTGENGVFKLEVIDDGVGLPKDFDCSDCRTFGMRLVNVLVRQLNARSSFSGSNGTSVSLELPPTLE